MAKVRVFQNSDGSVRVMRPNPRLRLEGEAEDAFVARICGADQAKDPVLVGLTFADIDSAVLPPRSSLDAQGDERSQRGGWRWDGTAVVLDATAIPPQWGQVMHRLAIVIPPVKRAVLADFIGALRQAVEDRDVAFVQALYDRLKTLQVGLTPPLSTTEFDAVKQTITEKKIPIVL